MATAEKIQTVEGLTAALTAASGVYLTDFTGLTVHQMQDLRRKCRAQQVEYKVVKRTLLQRAARNVGMDALTGDLKGPCGVVVSREDAVAPARLLTDFARTNDKLVVRLAVIEGKAVQSAQVKALAALPSKPELQAMLLGVFNAPAAKLLGTLQAGSADLLSVLQQRGEGKGDNPAPGA